MSDLECVCYVDLFIFVPIVFPVDFLTVVKVLYFLGFFLYSLQCKTFLELCYE